MFIKIKKCKYSSVIFLIAIAISTAIHSKWLLTIQSNLSFFPQLFFADQYKNMNNRHHRMALFDLLELKNQHHNKIINNRIYRCHIDNIRSKKSKGDSLVYYFN